MNKNKNILIICGYGFLGQGILKTFNNKNYQVSILDKNLEPQKLIQYKLKHLFKYSTLENEKMDYALNTENWDYIIHLAAFVGSGNGLLKAADEDFQKAININVTGFANLLNKFRYFYK